MHLLKTEYSFADPLSCCQFKPLDPTHTKAPIFKTKILIPQEKQNSNRADTSNNSRELEIFKSKKTCMHALITHPQVPYLALSLQLNKKQTKLINTCNNTTQVLILHSQNPITSTQTVVLCELRMKRFSFAASDHHHQLDMAKVLMLLSRGRAGEEMAVTMMNRTHGDHDDDHHHRVFECKTCNRQFSSFQALGGHRASHKKPRLSDDDNNSNQSPVPSKPKVHECSICGLEFSIGQALGGHMRRHRAAAGDRFGPNHGLVEKIKSGNGPNGKRVVLLDLNLPPKEDEVEFRKLGLELELGLGEKAAPMVDCLH